MSNQVNHRAHRKIMSGIISGAFVLFFSASAFAEEAAAAKVDADAAIKLARTEHCLRCHSVDKKKEGPTYREISKKYKGQSDAFDKMVKHITSGEDKVKLSDGHEETHKFDKATDIEQVKNLIRWVLAQ
jgi:cytochrome c